MLDDYPDDKQLTEVRTWDASDCNGVMARITELWHYPEPYAPQLVDGVWEVSTGGWSGNEDIIGAMQENQIWWLFHWQESRRGGHYKFKPGVSQK